MLSFTCSKFCTFKYLNKRKNLIFVQSFEKLAPSPLKHFILPLPNHIFVKRELYTSYAGGGQCICKCIWGGGYLPKMKVKLKKFIQSYSVKLKY